MSNMHLF